MNIGVFDSGLGGLWILKYLREKLPEYNYIFFGDQANVPYGTKSKEDLFAYTTQALLYLYKEKNCLCVILACNTTSTAIFTELRAWVEKEFPDRRVFGIVLPTVLTIPVVDPVAVFATHRTVESHVFKREIKGDVTEVALPELCSRIESGGETKEYIASFASQIPDTVKTGALCCTHYGIVRDDFIHAFPNITKWISQEEIIPEFFKNYLESKPDFDNKLSKQNKIEIYVTKESEVFNTWLKKWYQNPPQINIIKF